MKKVIYVATVIGLLVFQVMAQGNAGRGQGMGPREQGEYARGNGLGAGRGFNGGMTALISTLPYEELSEAEIEGLLHMREEEKLARDVYLSLYREWNQLIFQNIAESEQRHMDAVKTLLEKYNLLDPVFDDTEGVFTDLNLQNLYHELVNKGRVSRVQALYVGATIEDLDIFDLMECIHDADNVDIKTVYQNLMKGSRNHLRAFVSQLLSYEVEYSAVYLTQQEIDEIINSPMERGHYDQDGKPFYPRTGW
jgi:hypothetical protein